jgi:ankyrin repeat protein
MGIFHCKKVILSLIFLAIFFPLWFKSLNIIFWPAVKRKQFHFCQLLLLLGANKSFQWAGISPIHLAAKDGDVQAIAYLTKLGENVNLKSLDGTTPLHYAALENQLGAVIYLISQGAEVNAKNGSDETPLHWAAWCKNVDISKILIEKGANLERKDKRGLSPLLLACLLRNFEVGKLFLLKGANVNSHSNLGEGPLHKLFSVFLKKPPLRLDRDFIQMLIASGAGINDKNNDGKTPLDLAKRNYPSDELTFLLQNGAK